MMRLLVGLFAVLCLCVSVPAQESYTIQPEDVLAITVYGQADLSREAVVLRDGHFQYPLAGAVSAAGKSSEEVARIIANALKSELKDPLVTVAVKQPAMRRVYVSGLVAKSGSYDLKPGWRVSHLIAEAGGLAGSVDGRSYSQTTVKPEYTRATLVRGDERIPVDLEKALAMSSQEADLPLRPGDLLQIMASTNLVHVAGQVRTPGDYQMKEHLGVVEAVSAAGGPTDRAALTRAQVVRAGAVIPVNLRALLVEGKSEGNIEVMAGDTIVLPANENQIAVLGGVQTPGYFELPDGKAVTVADAIGLAHGARPRAHTKDVNLIREVNGQPVITRLDVNRYLSKGDVTQNPTLKAGDVIYIPDPSTVDKGVLSASAAVNFGTGLLFRLLFP